MNIFKKLAKNLFNNSKKEAIGKSFEVGTYQEGAQSPAKKKDYLSSMEGWVYSAVSAIADEISSIELRLYKHKEDGETEEVKKSEILDLIYKVNSYTTKFDLFWMTQASLELCGEAAWLIERDQLGRPTALHFLRADKLTPVADKNKIIAGYIYNEGMGGGTTLGVKDVMFFKYPSPLNQFRGIGTLSAAARTVDIDEASEKWNLNFFQNSARPDAILTVPGFEQMSDEQKNKLKRSLQEKYQGVDKAHSLMVLFGEMKLDKFGFNASEMDFLEQQKFGRDKILGIFRVPKSVVAQTEGVNFASAKASQYVFARYTIKPKIERIVQQLNEFFVPLFSDSTELFLDYDNPIIDDEDSKIKKYQAALGGAGNVGWMSVNEVRYEENLEPVENGDDVYVPSSDSLENRILASKGLKAKNINIDKKLKINNERVKFLMARNKEERNVNELNKKIDSIEAVVKKTVRDKISREYKKRNKDKIELIKKHINKINNDVDSSKKKKQLSVSDKKNFWVVKNFFFEKYVNKLIDIQNIVFEQQRQKVLDNLKENLEEKKGFSLKTKKLDKNKILLNESVEGEIAIGLFLETIKDLFRESGNATFELLDSDMSMDVDRKYVEENLKKGVKTFAVATTKNTNNLIWNEIETGLAANEGPADISKRINNVFNNSKKSRADLIARTETARYNTNANEQAFIDSGVVASKEWIAEPSACPECAALNGKRFDLGKPVLESGESINNVTFDYDDTQNPPLHPNCVCDIVPIFKDE